MPLQMNPYMSSKEYKKIILDRLTEVLKPNGFKKTATTFFSSNGDLTYFIKLQSSQSTTLTTLKATVNIEIYSALVYKLQDTGIPEKWIRHYTERIGLLLNSPHDKWWIIENENEAVKTANEIADIIKEKVFTVFGKLTTTNDLAELWRQNKCPGLTEYQRKEYLKLVDMGK
jgi:hypothetical protein